MTTIIPTPENWYGVIDKAYVDNYRFVKGESMLSTVPEVMQIVAAYLLIVYSLKKWIAHRGKPFDLRRFAVAYNLALSAMSAVLFYVLVDEVYRLISTNGVWDVLCDEKVRHASGAKTFIITIIYWTKMLELTDTVLLCLRGKAVPFIHWYHHAITVIFTWLNLREEICAVFTMPILNLFVHVWLYLYFALYDMGMKVWWKKYLTMLQITQFYIMLLPSAAVLIPRVLHFLDPALPGAAACHGTWTGALTGMPILLSYLVLFQRLYNTTYTKKPVNGDAKPTTKKAESMKKVEKTDAPVPAKKPSTKRQRRAAKKVKSSDEHSETEN